MLFENLRPWQIVAIFIFVDTIYLIYIIHMRKKNMRYTNGCYKKRGQDVIFLCTIPKEEVLHKLSRQTNDDTLYYDLLVKDGKYYIHVKGVKKYGKQDLLTGFFEMKLEYGRKGMYLVISSVDTWYSIFASKYEIELYEFIINKIGAIPVESVQ